MSTPDLRRIVLPATPDAPNGDDFRAVTALAREISRDHWGSDDFSRSDLELLQSWTDPNEPTDIVAAFAGERIVGYSVVGYPIEENTHVAQCVVRVVPGERRRGIGTVLAQELGDRVRASGRTTVMSFVFLGPDDIVETGERVRPSSGAGSAPADSAGTRFAQSWGLELGLVNRISVADVRAPDYAALEAEAWDRAQGGYVLVSWSGPTAVEHLEDLAALNIAISTDAPTGDLELGEENWTPERIVRREREVVERGETQWITAAQHVTSGRLVAFTVMYTDPAQPERAEQDETVVLSEHRGHRLGLLIKARNSAIVRDRIPSLQRVYTWNAAQNDHMLSINARLGFRPAGGSANWQRSL